MGLVQREIEAQGIATVSLTNMPFIISRIGVPRAVAIEFPFGMIYGQPGDRRTHARILGAMLELAETAEEPGTIVEMPDVWPDELFQRKDWFSPEPPPWMADQDKIVQMLEFISNGNPLE